MIDREVTHDMKVLIDSEQALNDKLQHLEELKEYLTPNEYKFSMANIVATAYIKSMQNEDERVTRTQILTRVNEILGINGVEPVSYQFIRKLY